MPELPDLEYIVKKLAPLVITRRVTDVNVKEPIVIRMLVPGSFADNLVGRGVKSMVRHGPFLTLALDGRDLIIHHMLAGRLQLAPKKDKPVAHLCFSIHLDNDTVLHYGDDKKMGKVYVTEPGRHDAIPGYDSQGVDIVSDAFDAQAFEELLRGRRQQVRVFLMDQTALSAIGNAYADEILFAAHVHPKTFCHQLSAEQRGVLYRSIRSVIAWGIVEVEKAAQPSEVKVRDHMRVRNRKGRPCPVCGTTIRTVGVLGHDSFFCPQCQPAARPQKIPWS